MLRKLIGALLVLVVLGSGVCLASADVTKVDGKRGDRKVEPMAITNGHLEFNPSTTS